MDKEKELFLEQKIAHMSLEEKIGQLFYMDYRNIQEMDESLRNILETYQPGGFLLFKSNIKDFEQLKKFIKDIKELLRIPILIGIDQEGGRVQQIKNR